ncbi:MAG: hypothetical protein KF708_18850 [Pirellulales bacterium]|nr:hypothetical protein [Pirellulales bacterium]
MLFSKRRRCRSTPSRALGLGFRSRHISCEPLEERRLLSTSPGNPEQITQVGNELFFVAQSLPTFERMLWKTDGTAEGTVIVKDLTPTVTNAEISELTNVNGVLFFRAKVGATGSELWKTDGTATGTVMVKNIQADNGIYPGSEPSQLTNVNGMLYFKAFDEVHGTELWKSDGTVAGTVRVKDIRPGTDSSSIDDMTNVGGTLFFSANSGVPGHELWKSDGTETGTVLVQVFNDGQSHGLGKFTVASGELYFAETRWTEAGDRLWKSDGTVDNAEIMLASQPEYSIQELVEVDGIVYFGYGRVLTNHTDLWKSDGTAVGTELVKFGVTTIAGSSISGMTNVSGTLFFSAPAPSNGIPNYELWKSDGTEAGTVVVKDIAVTEVSPGIISSHPRNLVNVGGVLYFTANDGTHGRELWKSDGSETGTVMVKDLSPGTTGDGPYGLTNFNGTLFFTGFTDNNAGLRTLWKTDGTAGGTVLVRPPGTVSLPFGDDFNRAPGTDLGIYWVETDGDLGMTNGKMVLYQNTESTAVLNGLTAADVTVSGNVDLSDAEAGRSVGFIIRSQGPDDTNAYWGIFYKSDSGYAIQIYKNIGGATTPLRSISVGSISSGNLRFEVYGSTLNLYFENFLVTTVIDTSLTVAGRVGVRQTGGKLDNFAAIVATPLPSSNAVLPFGDSFDRAPGGFLGPFWTEHTGDAGINNDVMTQFANDTAIATVNGIFEENVSIAANINVSTTPAQYSTGLIARYTGPGDSDFYMARLFHSDAGSFAAQIWKNVGGVYTPLRSVTVASGQGDLRFNVVGNQLSLYFNNQLVTGVIDNSITAPGGVGVRLAGGSLDNFTVTELALPPVSNATLPFADGFNGPNTSSLGAFWTERVGDLGRVNNQLALLSGETSVATVNGLSLTDVEISAVVTPIAGASAGVLARYSGPGDSNGYLALLQRVGSNSVAAQIWKNTGSGWVNIAHSEYTPVSITSTSIRFVLLGNQLKLFAGGNLLCDIIDNDIAGPGLIGVRMSGGTLDNFVATNVF